MSLRHNKLLTLLITFFITSHLFAGANKNLSTSEWTKFAKKGEKKGVHFSETGLLGIQEHLDFRLKKTDALHFSENFIPTQEDKPVNLPIEQLQAYKDRAQAAFNNVVENDKFKAVLNGKAIDLPIGVKKQVGNKDYVIVLDSLILTPDYAYAVMYAIIEDTKNDKKLGFLGTNIRFTRDGGFTGDARLELMETYNLEFGEQTIISFLVEENKENYIEFDCEGFKRLHIDAKVSFSREMIVPENPDGTIKPSGQVEAYFETDLESMDNWFAEISNVPAFQISGLSGTSFSIGTLAFDYSDYQNPSAIDFPADYDSPDFIGTDKLPWQGFYATDITIALPKEFKLKNNSTGRISITGENILIDKMGFTGSIAANNLIGLQEGDLGGWDYSVEYISINVLKSTFNKAEFNGQVRVPITKETQSFGYSGIIFPEKHYEFAIQNKSNLNFPLWGAGNIKISADSYIKVALIDDQFQAEAVLTGQMDIGASINGKQGENNETNASNKLSLAQISFEKLHIQTQKPRIFLDPNGGAVSFGSPALQQKMSKLPISISDVGLVQRNDGDHTGIRFTLRVNLLGEKEGGGGFAGNATIVVWGHQPENKWKFYKAELQRIEIEQVKIAVLTLGGFIEFYRDDPLYGSGFHGGISLNIEISSGANIGAEATVMFGKMDSKENPGALFRYWYVDALVRLPALPLVPPAVYMNAIGGGASYGMRIDSDPKAKGKAVSPSGVTYFPDETKGLGLKAMLGVQGARKELYNGELALEILFNRNGGLSNIVFSGFVEFISVPGADALTSVQNSMGGFIDKAKKLGADGSMAEPASSDNIASTLKKRGGGNAAVLAQWIMEYNREKQTFSATFDVFVNVLEIIKGGNGNDHAGRIAIYFSPDKWYVHVGKPTFPLSLKMFDIGLATVTSYFCMGHDIPYPLPMPSGRPSEWPTGASGDVKLAKGVGIGARIKIGVSAGGAFYFFVGGNAGFDILIRQDKGVPCGINGWYGMGQAFVYVGVSAGLKTCITWGYPKCRIKRWKLRCEWVKKKSCIDIGVNLMTGLELEVRSPKPTEIKVFIPLPIINKDITFTVGKRC